MTNTSPFLSGPVPHAYAPGGPWTSGMMGNVWDAARRDPGCKMKLMRNVGWGRRSYFTSVSGGLNAQLRAFVRLMASDELMNGLFNKTLNTQK